MAVVKLTILGCGASSAVPGIGNYWGACNPNTPRNVRTRPSIALQSATTCVIVDAGPDFYSQYNRENLTIPDALIITHAHSDHINGIDEFRTLQRLHKRKFPLYAIPETMNNLHQRLDYMFTQSEDGFYPAVMEAYEITPPHDLTVGDISMTLFEQNHGSISSLGLRIGTIGYSTDVKRLDDCALDILTGIDTWIVDSAGYHSTTNPVHIGLEEIYGYNKRIGAKQVFLTHMPMSMDYDTLCAELPAGYIPAHDGLSFTIKL